MYTCVHCGGPLVIGLVLCKKCNRIFDAYQFDGDRDYWYTARDSNSFEEFKLNMILGRFEDEPH